MKTKYISLSYKILHSIVPCLMLTMSVGMIYSFSLFVPGLILKIGGDKNVIQFAFNLSIFFLGMGAAFFGPLVEKNIKAASWIATGLFVSGLAVTAMSIPWKSVTALYLGIGILCGIGEGIAYLCPCKNMLLWFSKSEYKGVVMAISIVTFGLGSSLCSLLYGLFYPMFGLSTTLWILAAIYAGMMTVGSILIRKPKYDKIKNSNLHPDNHQVSLRKIFSDSYIYSHWAFMFLNISMGLIIIGSCASILSSTGMFMSAVVIIMSLCGISNGVGRIIFPLIGDKLSHKGYILVIILSIEALVMFSANMWYVLLPIAIVIINATYGGGFATCPQLILEKYGTKPLSIVHGILLSAWGCASLFAYGCTYVITTGTICGYRCIPIVLTTVFVICLFITKGAWERKD